MELMKQTADILLEELKLNPGSPGGMEGYRQTLMLSLVHKAFMSLCNESGLLPLDDDCLSAIRIFDKEPSEGHQFFEISSGDENVIPVGKPIKHKSATKHSTGEAVYLDDLQRLENEIYMDLVISTEAKAQIISIDISEAEQIRGFIKFLSSKDVDDSSNEFHVNTVRDEVIFAKDKVHFHGQVIGAVLAKDKESARKAAKAIKIEYSKVSI